MLMVEQSFLCIFHVYGYFISRISTYFTKYHFKCLNTIKEEHTAPKTQTELWFVISQINNYYQLLEK